MGFHRFMDMQTAHVDGRHSRVCLQHFDKRVNPCAVRRLTYRNTMNTINSLGEITDIMASIQASSIQSKTNPETLVPSGHSDACATAQCMSDIARLHAAALRCRFVLGIQHSLDAYASFCSSNEKT